uniref:Uncharacterized protein n=1 Tax=Panagrolaimus sp. JU765 TaxID=591449 RepID=A0AC34Q7N2_9BILA
MLVAKLIFLLFFVGSSFVGADTVTLEKYFIHDPVKCPTNIVDFLGTMKVFFGVETSESNSVAKLVTESGSGNLEIKNGNEFLMHGEKASEVTKEVINGKNYSGIWMNLTTKNEQGRFTFESNLKWIFASSWENIWHASCLPKIYKKSAPKAELSGVYHYNKRCAREHFLPYFDDGEIKLFIGMKKQCFTRGQAFVGPFRLDINRQYGKFNVSFAWKETEEKITSFGADTVIEKINNEKYYGFLLVVGPNYMSINGSHVNFTRKEKEISMLGGRACSVHLFVEKNDNLYDVVCEVKYSLDDHDHALIVNKATEDTSSFFPDYVSRENFMILGFILICFHDLGIIVIF